MKYVHLNSVLQVQGYNNFLMDTHSQDFPVKLSFFCRLNCHIFLQISLIPMHTHLLWKLKQLHLMKRQNFVLLPWLSVRLAFDKESTSLGDTHPCEETCTRDMANGDSLTNSNNGSCDMSLNNHKPW